MIGRSARRYGVALGLIAGCGDDGANVGSGEGDGSGDATTTLTAGAADTRGASSDASGSGSDRGDDDGDGGGTAEGGSTTLTSGTGATDSASESSSGDGTTMGVSASESGATTGAVDPCDACPENFICKYDSCIPDLGGCTTNDDCPGDSYCDADGVCIPYGTPPEVTNDPDCQRDMNPGAVLPTLQCEWLDAAMGDPTEGYKNVYSAPMVAELNLDGDPGRIQPSIVMTTWNHLGGDEWRTGMIRVFDGRTCEEQMHAGGPDDPDASMMPGYGSQIVIADLDNDVPSGGHPEIMTFHRRDPADARQPAELMALEIDSSGASPELKLRWYGRDCKNGDAPVLFSSDGANHGPGVIDINDDGVPEVYMNHLVFDANGCLQNTFSPMSSYAHSLGMQNVVVDVDQDGVPDLVTGDRLEGWDLATYEWVQKPYFMNLPEHKAGQVAIADAGLYSNIGGMDPAEQPEIVVVSTSTSGAGSGDTGEIRLQTLEGTIVWGPLEVYRGATSLGGRGGPPTMADFDGDGQVEFAAAGANFYTVYDPDCDASLMGMSPPERPGGACDRDPSMSGMPDGVLWAQESKDASSNVTGSAVFDFNGDGSAEVVYSDECWSRVYEGRTGNVLFSTAGPSGTGMEFPVVVDVDGDFASEIVVARADNGGGCTDPDPIFPGSGSHSIVGGFAIFRDPMDLWANSRPIWNQHSYSVTHINDDGTVPSASATRTNWLEPGLNNFRQNTQGNLAALKLADLTVELEDVNDLCAGTSGMQTLESRVCNRGTNPVQDGVDVRFLETLDPMDDVSMAVEVCTATTSRLLNPGECETVSCDANLQAQGSVFVEVDPNDVVADCRPENDISAGSFRICPG